MLELSTTFLLRLPSCMASRASSPTAPDTNQQTFFTTGMAAIWAIALANLLFHVYFNNRYGYFRDEFNYMSCGDHLAWGYVDQPPIIPFVIHICNRRQVRREFRPLYTGLRGFKGDFSSMAEMQIYGMRTIHTAGRSWDQHASRGEPESNMLAPPR